MRAFTYCFQSGIAIPSGATIIKSLPPGVIGVAKPGAVPQMAVSSTGKQTIVIASPKPNVSGTLPTKIITALPRSAAPGATGTQYIVVTTRPGGVGAVQQTVGVSSGAAAGRVISKSIGMDNVSAVIIFVYSCIAYLGYKDGLNCTAAFVCCLFWLKDRLLLLR